MMRCRSILFLLLVWPLWLHGTEEPLHQTAINDALQSGRALWKVISPSDAGRTGKLQPSLYFPKQAWQFFSAEPPPKEENRRETLEIIWPDHSRAGALITWYGKGNKNACRPTHPGDQISPQSVGDLFVLMPAGDKTFHGYLLGTDEAAEAFCQDLGMEPGQRWGSYGEISGEKSSQDTLESWAAREAVRHSDFPTGKVMAGLARQAVQDCQPETGRQSADLRLMAWLDAEYAIYRAIERKLSAGVLRQDFATVEEFHAAAATMMNRRKSRAGHSLEAHVEYLLTEEGIAFDAQALIDGNGRPDILFPGKAAHEDPSHPPADLVVLGLKTTCRDRWRQVLNEVKRIPRKHLLTLQPALSRAQLTDMQEADLQLIVPAPLHQSYDIPQGASVLSVEAFVQEMKQRFPRQS
jgi:hypothetical protein